MIHATGAPASTGAISLRYLGVVAACVLLAASVLACAGEDEGVAAAERLNDLEARTQSLEQSLAALADENAALISQIAILRQELTDYREEQEAAVTRQDDSRESASLTKDPSTESKDTRKSLPEGDALARTISLVEDAGGKVHLIHHPEREEPTVLVVPQEFVAGATPLIVSLHGFGGDAFYQTTYVPLHERVNTAGFALLLPNGSRNTDGNRYWNPTDEHRDTGKGGGDDVAYLTELVAEARKAKDFGRVYFFGYSNGGFMSYHMACKGLPGLRAVAALAGTSYVEDSRCDGASPVSVLHVHGTEDEVIRYDGDEGEPDPSGKSAFYAGAQEMVARWSRRARCDWPEHPEPYATLDFDQYVQGPETQAFRLEADCAEGIAVELWMSVGSSHAPGYGDAFVDALVDWLLSQE